MEKEQEITVPEGTVLAKVKLVGLNSNAFSIMAAVERGLRREGNSKEIVQNFRDQAMAGNYDHLLQVAVAFVEEPFDNGEEDDAYWDGGDE